MLGDGRAVLIGEHIKGSQRYDIVLKGSGKTVYSRRGDGLATIMPMLREYIISEYMNAVKIPTSRSLAVITTGDKVLRERALDGSILVRTAESHIRVGTFEYAKSFGELEDVKKLADYTINRHFPNINNNIYTENKYISFLSTVVYLQACLIAKWQAIGFVHGVMNTDNMFISGETLDYGPCAFLDNYDPNSVFSSIDTVKRYSYKNQPGIAVWNLSRFAETILHLIHEDREKAIKIAQEEISNFYNIYFEKFYKEMARKLGIIKYDELNENDKLIINDFLKLLEENNLDYTNTFNELKNEAGHFFEIENTKDWIAKWKRRIEPFKEEAIKKIKRANPYIIPRNHIVDDVLENANNGDLNTLQDFLKVLKNPYNNCDDKFKKPPKEGYKCVTFCGT
ncbi:MAG: protein adenylyltransferase SelO family protein [Defluviitaleaceae bacterium]|nr:protein adenylyltransferase SelO family protein [Defluviitaleaceae bacterium]